MAFEATMQTEAELREIYAMPSRRAQAKQIDMLDEHCRTFIAHAPFVVVATSDGNGNCDASPKGGPPGFVTVLDDRHLAIPDLSGNNRLDSMRNLVASPGIALLFLVPGIDETLRVNGRGFVTTDPDVLARCEVAGARPRTALGVEVHEAFIHCAKAFRRSGLWDSSTWPDTSDMPSIACMLRDHARFVEVTEADVQRSLDENYRTTLWKAGGRD